MDSRDLTKSDFPTPAKRKRGGTKATMKERRTMGWEAAAIAYVQMENDEYRYPEGANRHKPTEEGGVINKRELMRRAGYAPSNVDNFDIAMGEKPEFWELVELHRIRRTDPMFRREEENQLWRALGGEALRNLYERLFYSPHSLSTEQHIKIVKLILDAGITLQKLGGDSPNKANALLDSIPEDKREIVMKDYQEKLRKELDEVEAIERAHKAVDRKEKEKEQEQERG